MDKAIREVAQKLFTDTRDATKARLRAKAKAAGLKERFKVECKFVVAELGLQDVGDREVIAHVSTESPDLDRDVILAKGWDLSYFRQHPSVMLFHAYGEFPSGTCRWIKAKDGKLIAKTWYIDRPDNFPREAEWKPDTVLHYRQRKVMKGYSVGFAILNERMPTDAEVKKHEDWDGCRIIDRALLLEYSDVPLPCNPEATQLLVGKGWLPPMEAEDDADADGGEDGTVGSVSTADTAGADGDAGAPDSDGDPDGSGASGDADAGRDAGDAGAGGGDGIERTLIHPLLGKQFDVPDAPSEPANRYLGILSEFLKTEVKSIFRTRCVISHAETGNYLSAFKHTTAEHRELDVRNIAENGREYPPMHEVIQLNSRQSDSFLISGMSFRTTGRFRYAAEFEMCWRGLDVNVYSKWEDRGPLLDIMARAGRSADENHVLRGEAFALSGAILQRKGASWNEVFLRQEIKAPIMRAAAALERKRAMAPSRGIILMGPPGTGKTLAGRILMNQTKATFIWISAKDFYRCGAFGGLSTGFYLARKLAPSVLFIEDVDNWLGDRDVDLIKTEMDGIEQYSGVLTILTTNYPERLPEAIIDRPGRFDDVLKIGLPGADVRAAMLRAWTQEVASTTLAAVVEKTKGYSGAHIRELVRYAEVIREEKGSEMGAALLAAIEKVEQQRQQIIDLHLEGSRHQPGKTLAGLIRTLVVKGKEAETRIAAALLEAGTAETSDEELDALPVGSTVTKPGFEETENEIRYRVRDPGRFQAGSFRRITLQRATPKVYAVIGRLTGEQSTTIQSLRFPTSVPDNWTVAKARQWVKDHPDAVKGAPEPEHFDPAREAHLTVLAEIEAGKYAKVDEEAIRRRMLKREVDEAMAFHRGSLD